MLTKDGNHQSSVIRRSTAFKPSPAFSRWLIGRPLRTADAPHQTIGKLVGLAVFASDALSSTAYATQEILAVVIAAGAAGLGDVFSIVLSIVALLLVVALS